MVDLPLQMLSSIDKGSSHHLPKQGLPTARIGYRPYKQSKSRGVCAALSECKTVHTIAKTLHM